MSRAGTDALKVFVSSVMAAEDLQTERDCARDAVAEIDLTVPWLFEYSPAEPDPAPVAYLREVQTSDVLIAVVSNSHSKAVQDEWETAEGKRIPILAFVRRLDDETKATTGRRQAQTWLRDRVKYRLFESTSELRDLIKEALVAELVRGYRKYRLSRPDFDTLLLAAPQPPRLFVRPATYDDQGEIRSTLSELVEWYPEISPWIEKVVAETDSRETTIRVADVGGRIGGVAVSRAKDSGVRKFSTLYVRPGARGEAIGPRLVQEEVLRAARDSVRKAYVTFADEIAGMLFPMLTRYGFVAEGISGSRYRPGSGEWVMSKTFVYGDVSADSFDELVLTHFVHSFGGVSRRHPVSGHEVLLPARGLFGVDRPTLSTRLVISTSATPEVEYERARDELDNEDWWFVSLYGRPADIGHWSHGVSNWWDGEDVATRLFPVRLVKPEEESLICTIRPAYADALIPEVGRPTLFAPERVQIRPDNAYYRAPTMYAGLRRGCRVFFYVSAPEQRLRGSARLKELKVDSPEELLAKYGSMGVFKFDQLNSIAIKHHGRVLALAFDWYQEHEPKLGLRDIRSITSLNPQSARRLPSEQSRALEDSGLAP
jgi:hypothetical protein